MEDSLRNNEIVWPGWETVGLIGRGSFGAVYEIQRDVLGDVEKAALKVISIPQNSSDIEELYSDGYDEESITSTFRSHLKSIVAEYTLMRKMNGCTNIVNCDDVRYVQHDDGIGWDIFIKMELLTPLAKAITGSVSEKTVVKLAKDICTALELCKSMDIVHRDIKPQNIFVSARGDYKLGDFGIAKTVEKTMGGTKIGTYKYMAPEVYNNQPYGSAADIYSLGLVLYWLLNERRMPFLPLPPEKLKAGMDDAARQRRLSGEKLPPPANGSKRFKEIVLKACAYDPKDRYSSAAEMKADLEALAETTVPSSQPVMMSAETKPIAESDDSDKTVSLYRTETLAEKTPTASSNDDDDKTVSIFSVTTTGGRVEKATPAEKSLPLDEESRYILPQIAVPPKGNVESAETEWECSCGNRNEINAPCCSACFKSKPVERGHVPNADERKAQNTGHKKNGKIRIVAICFLAVFIVSLVAPLLFAGPESGDYSSSQPSTNAQSETIHGHVHSYTVTVVSPTCTEKGYTYYRCQCDVSYYDYEIAALGHNYDAVVTPPAETVPGYTTYMCTRCGDTYQLGISHSDITLNVGDSFTLTLKDQNGKIQNVAWEASEAGCVAISGNRITVIAPTNPYIKVFATYRGITYYCIVRCMAETPGQNLGYARTPVVGRSYKLGLYNTSKASVYYFTGAMSGHYATADNDVSMAVSVTVEDAGNDRYYLSFVVYGQKRYIGTEVSGAYLNMLIVDENERTAFSWNDEYSTFVALMSDGREVFLGTYGNYVNFGLMTMDRISGDYPVHLYF